MSELEWLEQWYSEVCDGVWEHLYGIEIETLDNPGWRVKIDLRETAYEKACFNEIRKDNGEKDWLICRMENGIFEGCGDCCKLKTIIAIFRNCVENYRRERGLLKDAAF